MLVKKILVTTRNQLEILGKLKSGGPPATKKGIFKIIFAAKEVKHVGVSSKDKEDIFHCHICSNHISRAIPWQVGSGVRSFFCLME